MNSLGYMLYSLGSEKAKAYFDHSGLDGVFESIIRWHVPIIKRHGGLYKTTDTLDSMLKYETEVPGVNSFLATYSIYYNAGLENYAYNNFKGLLSDYLNKNTIKKEVKSLLAYYSHYEALLLFDARDQSSKDPLNWKTKMYLWDTNFYHDVPEKAVKEIDTERKNIAKSDPLQFNRVVEFKTHEDFERAKKIINPDTTTDEYKQSVKDMKEFLRPR